MFWLAWLCRWLKQSVLRRCSNSVITVSQRLCCCAAVLLFNIHHPGQHAHCSCCFAGPVTSVLIGKGSFWWNRRWLRQPLGPVSMTTWRAGPAIDILSLSLSLQHMPEAQAGCIVKLWGSSCSLWWQMNSCMAVAALFDKKYLCVVYFAWQEQTCFVSLFFVHSEHVNCHQHDLL